MSQLNEALRLIRVFHDKKIKDLAEELEVSSGYVTDIEKSNKKPSMDIIEKYAKVFNTTPSTLLFFSEELDKNKGPYKTAIRNKMLILLQALEDKALGK
ncbi:MAG: helix-turn-helix transcriptional regulator [Candidatus Gastranaerophilales bacterium]